MKLFNFFALAAIAQAKRGPPNCNDIKKFKANTDPTACQNAYEDKRCDKKCIKSAEKAVIKEQKIKNKKEAMKKKKEEAKKKKDEEKKEEKS